MIRRVVEIATWLGVTSLATAGLYWAFLNTPESRILTLLVSIVLAGLMIVLIAIVGNAVLLLAIGESRAASIRRGIRRAHWFAIAAAVLVAAVWAIMRGDNWISQYSGEISAWFITTFNWSNITPLFRVEAYVSRWLRWVVLPAAMLTAVASILLNGARALASSAWIRAAWRWQTLAIATLAFVVLMDLPWRLATWQPGNLPPTWIQPAFAGLRLLVVAVAMVLGAAIVVVTTAKATADASKR
jgi:hypothetical protein